MDFIIAQNKRFVELVIDYFAKNYNLHTLRSLTKLKYLKNGDSGSIMFARSNVIVLPNKVVNAHYDTQLDINSYSVIYILYRNLTYRKREVERNVVLDAETKKRMDRDIQSIRNSLQQVSIQTSPSVFVVGRKYNCSKHKTIDNNALGLLCKYTSQIKRRKTVNKNLDPDSLDTTTNVTSNSITRRKFLQTLKTTLDEHDIKYTGNGDLLRRSIFLDIEYINDIYDDFSSFPVSHDTSLMFMIGTVTLDKYRNEKFTDYTVRRLTREQEYNILQRFLTDIQQTIKSNENIIIFHWSPADKTFIERTLIRYPDLHARYTQLRNNKQIVYLDLLVLVRDTINLESYSLKYVAKNLLNITYQTDCQNGLSAMCSVIREDQTCSDLQRSDVMRDIIEYNKMDTTLLYKLYRYFTNL